MAKRYLWLLACGLLGLLAACDGNGGKAGTPGFTLSLTPDSVMVAQGGSGQVTAHVARHGGFDDAVTVTLEGAPSGISAKPLTIAGGAGSGTLKILADKTAAAKSYTVTVHAQGGAAKSSATLHLTVTAATGGGGGGSGGSGGGGSGGGGNGGASSAELIDKALADGKIDKETALIYKFYAAFGDPRLPAAYHGDDSKVFESGIQEELSSQLSDLSSQAQKTLSPFLIPPFYAGSWFDLQQHATSSAGLRPQSSLPCSPSNYKCAVSPNWTSVGGKNVKVWYLKGNASDKKKAEAVVAAVDSTIWPKLTNLMGRTPLSDADKDTGGGDGRLDITLTPLSNLGLTLRSRDSFFDHGCEDTSAYILINDRLYGDNLLSTVAHEFMHAIQFSYTVAAGCVDDYKWLRESTAAWAQTFVYPKDRSFNHRYIPNFLHAPETPLESAKEGPHAYGSHLFFLYLAKKFTPSWIRTIWDETQSVDNSLGAINAALEANNTNFKERWPEFTLYNWNRDPETHYQQWDGIKVGASYGADPLTGGGPRPFALHGQTSLALPLKAEVPHLAATYKYFSFPDSNVHLVTFFNGTTFKLSKQERSAPLPLKLQGIKSMGKTYALQKVSEEDKKGASVQALVKIAGKDWEVQDWTGKPYVSFCRDNPGEDIQKLVIIISNSEWQDPDYKLKPQGLPPTLFGSNVGCYQWKGTASGQDTAGTGAAGHMTVNFNAQNVLWKRVGGSGVPLQGGPLFLPYLLFQPTQGSISYTVSGHDDSGCTVSGSGTVAANPPAPATLFVFPYSLSGPFARAYWSGGYFNINVTYTCPNVSPIQVQDGAPWFWFDPSKQLPQLDSTGTAIKGTSIFTSSLTPTPPNSAYSGQISYDFHSQKQ